jgi:hypothetical protein
VFKCEKKLKLKKSLPNLTNFKGKRKGKITAQPEMTRRFANESS